MKEKDLKLIQGSVRRLYEAQQRKKKFDKFYDEVKKKEQLSISNFIYCFIGKTADSFDITLDEGEDYYTNHTKLHIKSVRRKSIAWDAKKLKDALSKKVFSKIVHKTYTVNDMDGLVKYLKSCGVDPKKFKSFIDVETQVDSKEIDKLYSVGDITKDQISGCYTVEMSDPYIKITELDKEQNE